MKNSASPTLAAGATGALTGGGLFVNPLWAILGGFAILAACTAIARVVPRRGTLERHG